MKKYLKFTISTLLTVTFCFGLMFVTNVNAQVVNPSIGDLGGATANGTADAAAVNSVRSGSTFTRMFILLWRAIITVGGLALLLYLVWGAVEWITAGGDSGKIQKARDKMIQSVIGMIILASSFIIVRTINTLFFGTTEFNLLQLSLPMLGGPEIVGP